MLPQYRTLSKLPRCRNFFSLVLGVIMVLNTPTTNQHNRTCFHGVRPFPHFHGVGTSLRFHSVGIYYGAQYPNNGLAQSSILPRYRTLSTVPQCRNFSTLPQCRNHSSGVLFRYLLSPTNLILWLTSGGAVHLTIPQLPSS